MTTVHSIRKRLEEASDGPWEADHEFPMFVGKRHAVLIPGRSPLICGVNSQYHSDPQGAANAKFIAHAREDIEFLLNKIHRREEMEGGYHVR